MLLYVILVYNIVNSVEEVSMSHAELILLALLTDGSSHAYGLVQRVRSMEVERWAAVSESTLYSVLRRLEDRDFVETESVPGERGKPRTEYTLAPAGRRRLDELVREGLESPAPMHSDRLVAAMFAASAGRASLLASAAEDLRHGREAMESARDRDDLSEQGRIVLDFYMAVTDAQRSALESLRELAGKGDGRPIPELSRKTGSG